MVHCRVGGRAASNADPDGQGQALGSYGALIDVLSDDSEWRAIWAEAVASASAELVSSCLQTVGWDTHSDAMGS
jgi:hypothetical protein